MEGPLSKWTNLMKGWQYRWFVLDSQTGLLSYYTSKEKMMRGSRRGCVRLKGALIGIDDEDDSTFTITTDQKTFHFQAQNAEEREKWVNALEETILRHTQLRRLEGGSSKQQVPTLTDFDRKMSEADAYLQILIDQVDQLGEKMDGCTNPLDREKHQALKDTTHGMLESVKQSIVMLQIAKNAVNPVNGMIQVESLVTTDAVSDHYATSDSTVQESLPNDGMPIPPTENPAAEVRAHHHLRTDPVPATSYSSSDEDDDFFDAEEHPFDGSLKKREAAKAAAAALAARQQTVVEDSDDEVNCEKHGSVIMHLLSQVKIGMDLTKVVLPTFILERRSLLEMYADFFAHPDIFASIGDFEDPQDRLVEVVRWFLSAFHAGRKGSVPKKPYNPIMGEIFQCYWNMDSTQQDSSSLPELVSDGPVPWASGSNVTFLAEQVSHHPPISAFYAENVDKQMAFNAHIWTKSKFLGLSIGVENVGQGCVSDLKHDEEYVLTFPNGYGRSILTIPWFELGGKCTVTCAKTGFGANITFHTKPFYGGTKNRITADLQHVSDRKPFMTVTGEWNGVMTAKWANTGATETFIDTTKIAVIKKRVRPVENQGEWESRSLWKDVTFNLKAKDMDMATNAKHRLEQQQRNDAKRRKEKNIKYDTKFFHEDGECWVYDTPLQKRFETLKQQQQQQQQNKPEPEPVFSTSTDNNSSVSRTNSDFPPENEVTSSQPPHNAQQDIQDLLG